MVWLFSSDREKTLFSPIWFIFRPDRRSIPHDAMMRQTSEGSARIYPRMDHVQSILHESYAFTLLLVAPTWLPARHDRVVSSNGARGMISRKKINKPTIGYHSRGALYSKPGVVDQRDTTRRNPRPFRHETKLLSKRCSIAVHWLLAEYYTQCMITTMTAGSDFRFSQLKWHLTQRRFNWFLPKKAGSFTCW